MGSTKWTGTGLAYHSELKRKREGRENDKLKPLSAPTVSADDVEAALSEALKDNI